MKKGIFILFAMLIMIVNAEAKTNNNIPEKFYKNYSYSNAVNFIERGVEFFIFTNGEFDFDIRSNQRNIRIHRSFNGRIRSIGNVNINYDLRGNVSRIGNVSIRYFRGRITNIGDLRVQYNQWGNPVFFGNVRNFYYHEGVRFNVSFGDVCDYNDAYFLRNDFRTNYTQFREDRNFYYYKSNPNARIGKRSAILKRRKPVSARNSQRNTIDRNSLQSYRKPTRRAVLSTGKNRASAAERGFKRSTTDLRNLDKKQLSKSRRSPIITKKRIQQVDKNTRSNMGNFDRKTASKAGRNINNRIENSKRKKLN
jgi:hypothetical protein